MKRRRLPLLLAASMLLAMLLASDPAWATGGTKEVWSPSSSNPIGHGVVSYDFVNGNYARAKMAVKDYSADGYCVEIWYDWVLRQPPGGHLHDDATGLRVCGVGEKRLWPTNGLWEYDDNPSVIDAATGIRITLCLWASGRQHRDSCTSWYPPDSRIPYQP